jgi:hypothetical protein
MKLLIVNQLGNHAIVDSNVIPRVGDRVDLFYTPYPMVTSVLLWPKESTLKAMNISVAIEAIITVD